MTTKDYIRFVFPLFLLGLALSSTTVKIVEYPETVYTLENLTPIIATQIPLTIYYVNANSDAVVYLTLTVINQNENIPVWSKTVQLTASTTGALYTYNIPLNEFPNFPYLDDGVYTIQAKLLEIVPGTSLVTSNSTYEVNISINEPYNVAIYDVDAREPLPKYSTLIGGSTYDFYWYFRFDGTSNEGDSLKAKVYLIDKNGEIYASDSRFFTVSKDYPQTVHLSIKVPEQSFTGYLVFEASDNHNQVFEYKYPVTVVLEKVYIRDISIIGEQPIKAGDIFGIKVSVVNIGNEDKRLTLVISTPWGSKVTKDFYIPAGMKKDFTLPVQVPSTLDSGIYAITVTLQDETGKTLDAKVVKVEVVKEVNPVQSMYAVADPYTKTIKVTITPATEEFVLLRVVAEGKNVIVTPTEKTTYLALKPVTLVFNYTPTSYKGEVTFYAYYEGKKVAEANVTIYAPELMPKPTYTYNYSNYTKTTQTTKTTTSGQNYYYYYLAAVGIVAALALGYYFYRKRKVEEVE